MKSSKKKPRTTHQSPEAAILRSAYSVFCWIPPVVRRLFEVNSEPHTGARPSVRLRVGLITLGNFVGRQGEGGGLSIWVHENRRYVHYPSRSTGKLKSPHRGTSLGSCVCGGG
jgi:hypothetical protein